MESVTSRGVREAGQKEQERCQGQLEEGRGSLGSVIQQFSGRQTKGACRLGQGAGSKGHEILKSLGQ